LPTAAAQPDAIPKTPACRQSTDRLRASAMEHVARSAERRVRGLRYQVQQHSEALAAQAARQLPARAPDHAKQEALQAVLEPCVDCPDNEPCHLASIGLGSRILSGLHRVHAMAKSRRESYRSCSWSSADHPSGAFQGLRTRPKPILRSCHENLRGSGPSRWFCPRPSGRSRGGPGASG
jgi:hypothetical protein